MSLRDVLQESVLVNVPRCRGEYRKWSRDVIAHGRSVGGLPGRWRAVFVRFRTRASDHDPGSVCWDCSPADCPSHVARFRDGTKRVRVPFDGSSRESVRVPVPSFVRRGGTPLSSRGHFREAAAMPGAARTRRVRVSVEVKCRSR